MVARNYRSPRSRSELDLVGWDRDTLCFIEVKTRTTRAIGRRKPRWTRRSSVIWTAVAREFLRKVKGDPPYRFDIVSVYLEPGAEPDITLFRDAFRGLRFAAGIAESNLPRGIHCGHFSQIIVRNVFAAVVH